MSRFRFTIGWSMIVVLCAGICLTALRDANPLWASTAFTLAIAMISAALVGAIFRQGRARWACTGFAIFGWVYLLISVLPLQISGAFGVGSSRLPPLMIEFLFVSLQLSFNPAATAQGDGSCEQVALALGIIFFGLIGAGLSQLICRKDH